MCDVIHVRRQLTHKGMRIARRNIVELQSLSRSLVSTVQLKHLNFSTELEHALKIVTAGSAKRRSVRTEYKSASKTLHCKTSWTQGFDGVRCLNRILISQTFLSPDENGFSRSLLGVLPGDGFSIIMYGETPTHFSLKLRHVTMSHLLWHATGASFRKIRETSVKIILLNEQ